MLRFYKRRFDIPESKIIKVTEEETKAQIAPYADYFTWEDVKRRMIGTITPVLAHR